MKKRLLIILSVFLSCTLIASLVEVFIFNFQSLTLDQSSQSIPELSFELDKGKEENTIHVDLDNYFVNKLHINYETKENIDYSLSYTHAGLYNKETTETIEADKFEKAFSSATINIGQTVSNLSIKYPSESSLKITQISVDNNFHFNIFRTIFILLVLMLIASLILFYRAGFKTEKLHIYFAVVASLLGLMFITAQPASTFTSWDDQIHFQTAVDWFGGNTTYSSGEYNLSNVDIENSVGRNSISSVEEKQTQIDYFNSSTDPGYTSSNSRLSFIGKLPYFPMALGYNLAKLLHLPFTICFYIGKIFNLLFFVILTAYAIKTIKIGKRLLAVIALIPTSIFLASSYSHDPIIFSGIVIFFAHLVNLYIDKKSRLDFQTALIMLSAISLACLAKPVYAPFILLMLLIPKDRFSIPSKSTFIKIGFICITLLLLVSPIFNGGVSTDTRGSNTSFGGQLSLIISHPLDYLTILKNNALDGFFARTFSINTLTSFAYLSKMSAESNFYFIIVLLLVFTCLTDNKDNRLSKIQRLAIFTSMLPVIALIWTILYLSYTEVGSEVILGVQGRYFIPLFLPLLLIIQPKNIQNSISPKLLNLISLAIPAFIIIISIYNLILLPYSF